MPALRVWAGSSLSAATAVDSDFADRLHGLTQEAHIAAVTLNFYDGTRGAAVCGAVTSDKLSCTCEPSKVAGTTRH